MHRQAGYTGKPATWAAAMTMTLQTANRQTKTQTRRNEAISARNDRASRPYAA